ncbi:MAG: secretion system protein [Candidatus Sericytochromatia bacterium]|nr:MAG: secretion system protein [Candidatus Sericytochromatia bacterium]
MNILMPALIAIIIFIVVFLLIAVFSKNIENFLEPLFQKYLNELEKDFTILNLPFTPMDFLKYQVGAIILMFIIGLLIGDGIFLKILISIILSYSVFVYSNLYITNKKKQRKQKFEEQFVDALEMISNGVRSGLSLMQALEVVVNEMEDPISYEINLVIQSTRVGVSLANALNNWAERINSPDLDIFVTAVIIQNQTGGNLAEILETLAQTIRERFRIQRQIKTLTAQGVASSYILTGLPIFLIIALMFIQPETMKVLYTTTYGLILSGFIIIMISIGSIMVRKIINIDI